MSEEFLIENCDSKDYEKIKSFIKNNAYWIHQYINEKILKDIGIMNSSYFENIIEEIFVDNICE